jgi:hypothetical protein
VNLLEDVCLMRKFVVSLYFSGPSPHIGCPAASEHLMTVMQAITARCL